MDRLAVRVLVTAGLAIGMLGATGVTSNAHPAPGAVALGVCAAAVTVAAFVGGGAWWISDVVGAYEAQRWPTPLLWALSLGAAVLLVALPSSRISWIAFVPIATVARAREGRPAAALLVPAFAALGYACARQHSPLLTTAINLGFGIVIVVLLQQRRRQIEAAELASAQAQVIAQERARTATADRQREVAAQLHDVLAHSLSGLIVSLQTAGLQARQEGASLELQQQLSAATEFAKDGLAGAREAVESLHGAASTEAGPLDLWLAETTSRLRAASGAEIVVEGRADVIPPERRELARAVLREALTNTMRHAPGLPVRIVLAANEIRVLTIGDISHLPPSDQVSGGHGLDGLRRRVEAGGGRFSAGATAQGWLVTARWETP